MALNSEALNFTKTLKYLSYRIMNESAMLLHTIQCRSDAVSSPEHRGGDAKAMKTQLPKLKLWRGGGNQLW
jgi:hypothetical protein